MKTKATQPHVESKPGAERYFPANALGIAALVVAFVLMVSSTWALFEFVIWNNIPSELVGKWEVADGPQEGATFDFYRSSKMIGHINQGGNLAVVNAQVRVDANKIYSTTINPRTGQETTTVQTIKTLTAHELIVEDKNGARLRMTRAQ